MNFPTDIIARVARTNPARARALRQTETRRRAEASRRRDHDGTVVKGDYVLQDKDIVELHV